ncbi:MAG TPA: RNA polymerase factor sigma-32 [Polyangiaceae bacterium]|nr:RNA polymerase factor sigma-32 [Polyangiaceae bacterium]
MSPKRKKDSESLETAEEPQESAPDSPEDGEQADEPDLDDDAVLAEAELVPGEFDQDSDLEDAPMPVLVAERAADGNASIAKYDPLQAYMREVQQHPLLSKAEEHDLAVRYVKSGDLDAAARLVTANLRLVVKLAYEYRRAYRNMMDLIQEGNIGLMQAVKRYDPYRGVKLSSYAAWWIRAYMLRYMLNNWRMVKLGTTQAQRKLFFNLNKEKARLSAMGIEPTPTEIAERLQVDEKEVIEMDRRLARGDASLDAPVGDGEASSVARVELLPSGAKGPEQDTTTAQLNEILHDQLQRFRTTLAGKDAIIFDKRMIAEDPLTLQELGDEFGVSRERVRQLEARISGKLRTFLKQELGDDFEVGG